MAKTNENMRTTIDMTCPACGKGQAVPVYIGINTAEQPELKASVQDGSLFVWECPHCGCRNLTRTQLLYHDPAERLMVWLLPEGIMTPEKIASVTAMLERKFADPETGLDGYTMRRVSQAGDLIEKVNIHDAGLDDVVVELAKWVTRRELAEKDAAHAEELLRAPFRFYRMDGADQQILLSFPLGGAMQSVPIGLNVYEDCRGIVLRNPAVRPPAGFAVVDAAWVESFLG